MASNDRISAEMKRLNKIFKNIDVDKRNLCANLIQNAAFIAVSLQDLQEQIKADGWIEEYQNGENQHGKKPGSASQVYTKLISNYNAVIRELVKLLPSSDKELARIASDPMADFLTSK